MLKRDIFIGFIIFMLFAIGFVMTLENIQEKQNAEEGDNSIGIIHTIKNQIKKLFTK